MCFLAESYVGRFQRIHYHFALVAMSSFCNVAKMEGCGLLLRSFFMEVCLEYVSECVNKVLSELFDRRDIHILSYWK